jgi:hypothetical protein
MVQRKVREVWHFDPKSEAALRKIEKEDAELARMLRKRNQAQPYGHDSILLKCGHVVTRPRSKQVRLWLTLPCEMCTIRDMEMGERFTKGERRRKKERKERQPLGAEASQHRGVVIMVKKAATKTAVVVKKAATKTATAKKAAPVKKGKAGKPARRQAGPNEVAVGVRWFYKKDFAKVLGKDGTGKGRARRKDVKAWAAGILDDAAKSLSASFKDE